MLFEDPKGNSSVIRLKFRYASFWVQFLNLPRVCFCRKYAEALGNSIGAFEYVETDDNGKASGESLRVRVQMDITEPIKRGTNIKAGSKANKTWIPVTYEKLLDFCYQCGKLGHVCHECEEEGTSDSKENSYGPELRAT